MPTKRRKRTKKERLAISQGMRRAKAEGIAIGRPHGSGAPLTDDHKQAISEGLQRAKAAGVAIGRPLRRAELFGFTNQATARAIIDLRYQGFTWGDIAKSINRSINLVRRVWIDFNHPENVELLIAGQKKYLVLVDTVPHHA